MQLRKGLTLAGCLGHPRASALLFQLFQDGSLARLTLSRNDLGEPKAEVRGCGSRSLFNF